MIRAIVACDDRFGIGRDGTLPWPHNKEDLRWFKRCTDSSIVIMGSNTWEDPKLPKPLPNRYNVVVSDKDLNSFKQAPNVVVKRDKVKSFISCIDRDVWIIGGATLFAATWDIVEEVWVSRIDGDYSCDTFIPSLDPFKVFYQETDYDKNLKIRKYRR